MKWTREKQTQQLRQQRRDNATGFGEAEALVRAAYGPPHQPRQQLSKAELRAMAEAAAASYAERGVAVQRCPAQSKPPAAPALVELRIEPKRPKLR